MTKVTRRNFIKALVLGIGASPAIVTSVVALEAGDAVAVAEAGVSQVTTGGFSSFYEEDLKDVDFSNHNGIGYRTEDLFAKEPVWYRIGPSEGDGQ